MLTSNKNKDSGVFSQDIIVNATAEFNYMPEEVLTFSWYFCRYKDLYEMDCVNWSDHEKVTLVLRKLGYVEYTKFVNYILRKKQKKKKKKKKLVTQHLKKWLLRFLKYSQPKTSLFHKRWKCINLVKKEDEEFTTFDSIVNNQCDGFKTDKIKAWQF